MVLSSGWSVHQVRYVHVLVSSPSPSSSLRFPFFLIKYPAVKIKARNLRDLEINSSRVGLVGDLMRKGTAYDVWALDPAVASAASGGGSTPGGDDQDGQIGGMISSLPTSAQVAGVGAEELNGLSVLLPCKRKGGRLYLGAFAFAFARSTAFLFGCGSQKAILSSSKAHHAAPCSLCAPREAHQTRGCL